MATTTNYGWTTPDNSGYVKDGALAIRTLGSAIDTTLYGVTRSQQVVQTVTSTVTTSTSTTYADATNMTATITPTKNTSKVLITVNFPYAIFGRIDLPDLGLAKFRINTGATELISIVEVGHNAEFSSGAFAFYNIFGSQTMTFLHSPATTSAVTYKLQFASTRATTTTVEINGSGSGTVTLEEVIV